MEQRKRSFRQANQMVIQKTGGNTGQASGTVAAAKHPVYRTITNLDQVKQAVWHYNAKLAAPVVAPHTAEDFPWQRPPGGEPPVDEFELLSRGKESSLAHRLTRSVFDARLRMAANGKAAGSDIFTNELLKHLPDSHKDMLFSFYQLCWATGRTPAEWKHSETVLFHKKGEAADPANYRPIALHLTIYKPWTSIITQVLQDYAEEVGMLNSAQEGFCKFRNCARQPQLLTSTIEDAKSSKQNLFLP